MQLSKGRQVRSPRGIPLGGCLRPAPVRRGSAQTRARQRFAPGRQLAQPSACRRGTGQRRSGPLGASNMAAPTQGGESARRLRARAAAIRGTAARSTQWAAPAGPGASNSRRFPGAGCQVAGGRHEIANALMCRSQRVHQFLGVAHILVNHAVAQQAQLGPVLGRTNPAQTFGPVQVVAYRADGFEQQVRQPGQQPPPASVSCRRPKRATNASTRSDRSGLPGRLPTSASPKGFENRRASGLPRRCRDA
jgi:hypothetical protein